jgi:hypothetical protein
MKVEQQASFASSHTLQIFRSVWHVKRAAILVGEYVGVWLGAGVGAGVGTDVGVEEGIVVGAGVGSAEGAAVGAIEGVGVGLLVKAAAMHECFFTHSSHFPCV